MVPYEDTPPFALTITGGGESGEQFTFEQPEVTLGRIADNDLVLYDASVSRRHAVVYYRNNQFILEDLGSSNGTILNGYLINQPTVLCEGDQLVIGAVHFQFATMIFGQEDDPTEIEGWIPNTSDSLPQVATTNHPNPSAVPRGVAGQQAPMPFQGSTQAFSAHRIAEVFDQGFPSAPGGSGPAFPQFPEGPPKQPLGFPGSQEALPPMGSSASQPQMPQANVPQSAQPGGSHGHLPQAGGPPHGTGSQHYHHPPSHGHLPQAGGSSAPVSAPSMRVPPPAEPPPAIRPPASPPPPRSSAASLEAAPQPAPDKQKQRKVLHIQRQQMIQMSLWSGVLFLLSSAFFLIPSRSTQGNDQQDKAIFLPTNAKESEVIYGYNKQDKTHPDKIRFQFSYRNGRTWLSYRILTPVSVDLLLNGKPLTSVSPSPREWRYHRHELPRSKLKNHRFNYITFKRLHNRSSNPLWGLTHIQFKEQSLPSPDLDKAKAACKLGYKLYQKQDKKPQLRYQAIIAFQECMDYVTLMLEPPPLYKEAELMITRINNGLDVIYRSQLQQAKNTKDLLQRVKLYDRLLAYFRADPADERFQRIQQLLQQHRKSSGN